MPSSLSDVLARIRLFAAAAGVLASTIAAGQQPPRFSDTIDVSLVNVDVIVTDRAGQRVRGLTAADFTVLEEGRPQTIVNFAEYSSAATPAAVSAEGPARQPAAERPPRQPRTLLVFIDEPALVFSRTDYRGTIADVIRKTMQPGDVGAVLTWTKRMNVRQGFTGDVDALLAAVEKLPGPGPLPGVEGQDTQAADSQVFWESLALLERNRTSEGLYQSESPERDLLRTSAATTAFLDMKSKARAINAAMTAVGGAEGRKVLLLVTHRFSRRAGLERAMDVRYATEGPPSTDARWDQLRLVDAVAATANATGFAVYGVYPEGMPSTFVSAESTVVPAVNAPPVGARDHMVVMNESEPLERVTERTGGEYAIGADVLTLLPRVAEDLTEYYSLGYRTVARGTDNRRKLVVRAKNPEYTVRARTEFVERSADTRMKDRVTASVFASIDPGSIPIRVQLGERSSVRDVVPLKIEIPISALATVEKGGRPAGAFSVYVAWNSLGTVSESTRRTQEFTIAPDELERAKESHFSYRFDVRLDEDTSAIGVGVLDETSKEYGVVTVAVPPAETKTAARSGGG